VDPKGPRRAEAGGGAARAVADGPQDAEPLDLMWALVRRSVQERRPLGAHYGRSPVLLWPYVLGWSRHKLYVRALIVGGGFRDEHWVPLDDLRAPRPAPVDTAWIPPWAEPSVALVFFDRVDCTCEDYAYALARSS